MQTLLGVYGVLRRGRKRCMTILQHMDPCGCSLARPAAVARSLARSNPIKKRWGAAAGFCPCLDSTAVFASLSPDVYPNCQWVPGDIFHSTAVSTACCLPCTDNLFWRCLGQGAPLREISPHRGDRRCTSPAGRQHCSVSPWSQPFQRCVSQPVSSLTRCR